MTNTDGFGNKISIEGTNDKSSYTDAPQHLPKIRKKKKKKKRKEKK